MKIGVGVEPSVRLGVTADSNIQMVLGTAGASSWTLEGCWTTLQFMAEKLKTSAVIITLFTVFSGEALTEGLRP